jgi:SAM-dependent methyltransferase
MKHRQLGRSVFLSSRAVFLNVFPDSVRHRTRDTDSILYNFVQPVRSLLKSYATHDDIYDRTYYEGTVEPLVQQSAATMANSISTEFAPTFVVDVGCGTGELLKALRGINVSGLGLEYSSAALAIARAKGLNVQQLDLEKPLHELPFHRADVAISTEVAEHLPESFADGYVSYLCQTSDTVVITAAIPGQGGDDHVNEQPNSYWVEKFATRGFDYCVELTMRLRKEWGAAGVTHFYASNLMIFRKRMSS